MSDRPVFPQSWIEDLFSRLGLETDRSVNQQVLKMVCPKFRFFFQQNVFGNTSLCGLHKIMFVVVHYLQKMWWARHLNPPYGGPIIMPCSFARLLFEAQGLGWIGRKITCRELIARLSCVYCVDPPDVQMQLKRLEIYFSELKIRLNNFKEKVSFRGDYLQQILPGSLSRFIQEVGEEKKRGREILLGMARMLFSRSVRVQETELRARKMAVYVDEIVKMASRPLPCLTEEHRPVTSPVHEEREKHFMEKIANILSTLPLELIIPELCSMVFRSRRAEFLMELCRSLLSETGCPTSLRECVAPGMVDRGMSTIGYRAYEKLVVEAYSKLGKIPSKNLLEVLCGSFLVLEPELRPHERMEVESLLRSYLIMVCTLSEASQNLEDPTPRSVCEELKEIVDSVDYLVFGEDFVSPYTPRAGNTDTSELICLLQ